MKHILIIIIALFTVQLASAQDSTADEIISIRLTLTDADGQKAKSLKSITNGELVRGESQNVFIVSTTSLKLDQLKTELSALFDSAKVELIDEELK